MEFVQYLKGAGAWREVFALDLGAGVSAEEIVQTGLEQGADYVLLGTVRQLECCFAGHNWRHNAALPVNLCTAFLIDPFYKHSYKETMAIALSLKSTRTGSTVLEYPLRASAQATGPGHRDQIPREALAEPALGGLTAALGDFASSLDSTMARIGSPSRTEPALTATIERPVASSSLTPAAIRNVHVLVVGIDDYKDPSIPRLRYTETDAKAVYEFFKTSGLSPARSSNVHYLGDQANEDGLSATRLGIRKAITRYLINKAIHADDMAILYFAGHGDTGKHPTKGTEYYLIPQDAERADLFNTAIELSEFKRLWSAIRAETKILIADACNSGGFTGVRALGVKGIEGIEAEGGGKMVFSASKADQKSLEVPELGHGLFTHVMLEGLRGKADKVCGDNDGRVTAGELKRYLDEQVPARARKYGGSQTPVTQMLDAWGKVYLTR